ncbi:MAG: hypothetical protein U0869_16710 [Chloroflexota bacterium]
MATIRTLGLIVAAAAIVTVTAGCEASPLLQAQRRVEGFHHPAIDHVDARHGMYGDVMDVRLVPTASDQDARDVWCDVLAVAARKPDIQLGVSSTDDTGTRRWDRPRHCDDPEDVPGPHVRRGRDVLGDESYD